MSLVWIFKAVWIPIDFILEDWDLLLLLLFFFFEVPPPRTSGQIFSPALVDFSSLFSLPLFAPLFLVQTILVPPLLDYRGRMGGQRALGQKLGNSS